MKRKFTQVFKNLRLDEEIIHSFQEAEISDFHFDELRASLSFVLESNVLPEKSMFDQLKKRIKEALPELDLITIVQKPVFHGTKLNDLKDKIIDSITLESPLSAALLENSIWELEDPILKISIAFPSFYILEKKKIHRLIEQECEKAYHRSMSVQFAFDDTIRIQANKNVMEPAPKALSITKEKPKSPLLYGRHIRLSTKPIVNLALNETAAIMGTIISFEFRELQNQKQLFSCSVYDGHTSITCKAFLKKENSFQGRIKDGDFVKLEGSLAFDHYSNENILKLKALEICKNPLLRKDMAKDKRVELHMHSKMSSMDGLSSIEDIFKTAASFGHPAVAITDHGVVQAFPDAMRFSKKYQVKAIYGMEAYVVNDMGTIVQHDRNMPLLTNFVSFDLETTGLRNKTDRIIEIGAVRYQNGQAVESFQELVFSPNPLEEKIIRLTNITNEMLTTAPPITSVFKHFKDFIKDDVLVAHNASFDMSFIREEAKRQELKIDNPVVDTLELMRTLHPHLNKHTLDNCCKYYKIDLLQHHRAKDDARACGEIYLRCLQHIKDKQYTKLSDLNFLHSSKQGYKKTRPNHMIVLVKNEIGLRNLYELVSISHLEQFYRRPRIFKSQLHEKREGLIFGSACEAGELFRGLLESKPEEQIEEIVKFYDYLEIQPLENNHFLIENQTLRSVEDIKEINRKIVEYGKRWNKPVVATSDAHFIHPQDEIFRRIILYQEGFKDLQTTPLYFRTTEEMLHEFSYLGEEVAYELVVKNPRAIADSVLDLRPIPQETYSPKVEGADASLRRICMKKAIEIYGEEVPEIVLKRLEKELQSIIGNGFAFLYITASKLVARSLKKGYLVGSRGSVGSSLAATFANITEVNPLPAHYYCKACRFSDFDWAKLHGYDNLSGFDLPDRICPRCKTVLTKEGQNIPFETFLGFDGEKEPDIDLNFSGEIQQEIHAYTEHFFGSQNVFKAGTINTLAEKTAYAYVKKYLEENQIAVSKAEEKRLAKGCTGVKKTTGQHPGGLIVVPKENNVHEFTPTQRPANDVKSSIVTTHFDFNSLQGCLLKLDLLGHVDPSLIRLLYDYTNTDPTLVPFDDEQTLSLFTSTKALGVTPKEIGCETGTIGIPEFGTRFVRQMLIDTLPKTFTELVRISGLSHGTDVWVNNAQFYIKNKIAVLNEVIATRDDIMNVLIAKGLPKKTAFTIMEQVRKGKGLNEEDIRMMKQCEVPDWYIESCQKIKYMFPKAHATAYVMMAFRIAYYKINHPQAFYAALFTTKIEDFDYVSMCNGPSVVKEQLRKMDAQNDLSAKEKSKRVLLEIVNEMYARGISFAALDLYRSHESKFLIREEDNLILPPLSSVPGLGENAAHNLVKAREEGEFLSVEEFKQRTKISKTTIEILKEANILSHLPQSNQLCLF